MFDKIYQHAWITLPHDVREYLALKLEIPRSSQREVHDNKIVSDGITNQDLASVTIEKLKSFTGLEGDFQELWDKTIAKTEFELGKQDITSQGKVMESRLPEEPIEKADQVEVITKEEKNEKPIEEKKKSK